MKLPILVCKCQVRDFLIVFQLSHSPQPARSTHASYAAIYVSSLTSKTLEIHFPLHTTMSILNRFDRKWIKSSGTRFAGKHHAGYTTLLSFLASKFHSNIIPESSLHLAPLPGFIWLTLPVTSALLTPLPSRAASHKNKTNPFSF